MELSIVIYYKDNINTSTEESLRELYKTSLSVNAMMGGNKIWYEKGYSRKEALKYVVMDSSRIQPEAIKRWERRCKKDYPLLIEGIWDGGDDSNACAISYMRKHYFNPEKTNIEIDIRDKEEVIDIQKTVAFMDELVKNKGDAYSFIHNNGYWFNNRNVFPDRIPCGWMLYVPHVVLAELVPEAARVYPVINDEGKQQGTIILTTEEIFDGGKKEHIEKANDIEIRLLDLGLLPLMTEL